MTSKVTAKDYDSFMIRRAFIDVISVVPTLEELDWYMVYNTNGYEMAIDWLMNHKDYGCFGHVVYTKEYLMSNQYKHAKKSKIEKTQVYKNLIYVTGSKMEITPENIRSASLKLIKNVVACRSSDTDIIDYMCESLMGRTSNLEEINKLTKLVKNSKKNETQTWLDVLDEILELEDVNSK